MKCVEGMLTIVADFLGAIGSGTGILSGCQVVNSPHLCHFLGLPHDEVGSDHYLPAHGECSKLGFWVGFLIVPPDPRGDDEWCLR